MKKIYGASIILIFIFSGCDGNDPKPIKEVKWAPKDYNYGCMDPSAINYNAEADADDGNCEYEGFAAMPSPPDSVTKNVLLDLFTGEWCGWCVEIPHYKKYLTEMFPDRIYYNSIHYRDFLMTEHSALLIQEYQPFGYPTGMVDRAIIPPISRNLWASQSTIRANEKARLGIAVETKLKDNTTVEGLIHIDFKDSLGYETFFLHIYVNENNIPAIEQVNTHSGNFIAIGSPFYDLPLRLGPEDFTHHNVLREIVDIHKLIGKPVRKEGIFRRKFQIDLSQYIIENLELLIFVTDKEGANVMNVIGVKPGDTVIW